MHKLVSSDGYKASSCSAEQGELEVPGLVGDRQGE